MTRYFDQLAQTWDQDPMKIERSRATAEQCKNLALQNSKSLLDVGGGTGLLSVHLRDVFESITIADTSSEMLRVAQEKIEEAKIANIKTFLLENDISEIPDRYSAIITLMTLHHIADLDGFIGSAAKILAEHGTLMIADLYREDGSFHRQVEDYQGHNGFDIDILTKKLTDAAFDVTQANLYFEIKKRNFSGEEQSYPLFFLVAKKRPD